MKILLNGSSGKMGKVVSEQIRFTEGVDMLCGVAKNDAGDSFFPVFTDVSDVNLIPDVIIDFSVPEATFNILDFAVKNEIPIVIATTGFTEEQNNKIEEFSKIIPIFKSANMSYEINLMSNIVCKLAKRLKESDIEIVETHHNKKIDSPSGTALLLANNINKELDNEKEFVYDRHSRKEGRQKNEIGISSIRGGTEVGKHSVIFFGNNESLEITHNCNSRKVFAEGAIRAAKFIEHKSPGMYDMNDLLLD